MTLSFNKTLSITPVADSGGSSGGGETITAINAFGSNIKSGDKVWLNKHNNPEEIGTDFLSDLSSNPSQLTYDYGNVLYYLVSNLNRIGFANNAFSYTVIQDNISNFYRMTPLFVDGAMTIVSRYTNLANSNPTCAIVNPSTGLLNIKNYGMYIGDNKFFKYNNNEPKYDIVEYNPETDVEGSVLGSINMNSNVFGFAYYDKNTKTLLAWREGEWGNGSARYVEFYDLSDLSNITKKTETKLINDSTLYSLTGINTGDVVFIVVGGPETSWTKTYRSRSKKAYRIKADGTLEPCAVKSPLLQSLLDTGTAHMMFDNNTNILSVGTNENIYFFRFNQDTKEFTQIAFDITMPTEQAIGSNYNYIPTITADFSTLNILYSLGENNTANCFKMYKLVAQGDDSWYAEPYTNFNPNTLTGVAKDNIAVNESGEVTVGGYINNQDKIITTNGIYSADEGYTGLGTVNVNVPVEKYGASISCLLGDVDADGVLQAPTEKVDLVFSGVKKIGEGDSIIFPKTFESPNYLQIIKSASFPDLEEVYGDGFSTAFSKTGIENVSFPKLKKIAYKNGIVNNYAFSSAFADNYYYDSTEQKNKGTLKTVAFPELEIIEKGVNYCFYGAFGYNPDLTSISFPKLKQVLGGVGTGFNSNSNGAKITTTEVPALEEIGQNPFQFYQYSLITTADFPSLTKIGFQALFRGFMSCPNLQSVSFPALTSQSFGNYTNQFNQMLQSVTGCTVHFPSNLESVIGSWSDVTNGFGGTNTTVLFDLPATE